MNSQNFDPEIFETKYNITQAATKLYAKSGNNFTLKQVARETGLTVADIFNYFPNKKEILLFFYESLVIRYRLMLQDIEGFGDYLLAEKLSNFIYTSFDIIKERENFVRETFKPIILCSFSETEFEKQVEELLNDFFISDSRVSTSSSMILSGHFYNLLSKKYFFLIRYWLKDESKNRERTMELTDKYTSFLQEIMYSTAIDKGIDLTKFVISSNPIKQHFQSIKKMFPKIEIRD